MALSGLDIYKLLPKTNCKECGVATCLAFAMQLAKKAASVEKCPYVSPNVKNILEEAGQPLIKLITIGTGEGRIEIGNETVLFRHEEKFHRPCAIGFIIDDSFETEVISKLISAVNGLQFERVGERLAVNLIAIRQTSSVERFVEVIKMAAAGTTLAVMVMSDEPAALEAALMMSAAIRPLVYRLTKDNMEKLVPLLKKFNLPVVVSARDIDGLSEISARLALEGINDLVLDTGTKPLAEKLWDLTQARRQALKKSNRSLGFPMLAIVDTDDPHEEAMEAATYISKYAGIILVRTVDPARALAMLTLRQNIYTDPQKPLQVDANLYPVGQVKPTSPVLVTTNFSLTYYTVLGEVEASKVAAYILSVDTEGMSVLTAWSAEKFTPAIIADALRKFDAASVVTRKRLVLPGYVAMLSGELQDATDWEIIVGPKEAAGIPSFLKNL